MALEVPIFYTIKSSSIVLLEFLDTKILTCTSTQWKLNEDTKLILKVRRLLLKYGDSGKCNACSIKNPVERQTNIASQLSHLRILAWLISHTHYCTVTFKALRKVMTGQERGNYKKERKLGEVRGPGDIVEWRWCGEVWVMRVNVSAWVYKRGAVMWVAAHK